MRKIWHMIKLDFQVLFTKSTTQYTTNLARSFTTHFSIIAFLNSITSRSPFPNLFQSLHIALLIQGLSIFLAQETHHLRPLYHILPLNNKTYTKGRYLFLALHCLIIPVPYIPLTILFSNYLRPDAVSLSYMADVMLSFLLVCLLAACLLPSLLKHRLPHPESRLYNILALTYIVPMIAPALLKERWETLSAVQWYKQLCDQIITHPVMFLLLFIAGLMLLWLSYRYALNRTDGAR